MKIEEIKEKVRRDKYEISFHAEKERLMHKYGDCSFCGGEVNGDSVELDYRYKGKLYIFKEVPAGVCRQCGEKYLTARVAKEIERMERFAREDIEWAKKEALSS